MAAEDTMAGGNVPGCRATADSPGTLAAFDAVPSLPPLTTPSLLVTEGPPAVIIVGIALVACCSSEVKHYWCFSIDFSASFCF